MRFLGRIERLKQCIARRVWPLIHVADWLRGHALTGPRRRANNTDFARRATPRDRGWARAVRYRARRVESSWGPDGKGRTMATAEPPATGRRHARSGKQTRTRSVATRRAPAIL